MNCIDHGKTGIGNGYWMATFEGKRTTLHRVAYCKANGLSLADIAGKVIRHKCDNPRCINPEHLEPGSQGDNNRDTVNRVRRNNNHNVTSRKLTDAQLQVIASRVQAGEKQYKLAAEFGVSGATLSTSLRRVYNLQT